MALRLCDAPASTPTWNDVIDEISASCRQRAPRGALLDVPGAIGVLAGPASVVWAYDETAASSVLTATDETSVEEIYVGGDHVAVAHGLAARGWVIDSSVTQVVTPVTSAGTGPGCGTEIGELGPGDLADVRTGLVEWARCDPKIIEAAYPDDFFTVAAPVTLLGARDHGGRLCGVVGVRRQARASMLFALVVSPAQRHSGVGAELVARAVRHARADGARFVHAQTNEAGAAVLGGSGFTAVGSWRRLVRAA